MDTKSGQQPDVLEKINRSISLSEEKRRKLRFEHSLHALAQGSIQILKNDEFVRGLAEFFPDTFPEKNDQKRKVLIALGDAVVSEESKIRERTLIVLSHVAVQYVQRDEQGEIFILVHSFCKWLEYETEILPELAVVFKRIEELAAWLFEMSFWQDVEKIISLLARIQSGELEKGAAIKSLAGQTLCNLATESTITKLTDRFLREDDGRQFCEEILLRFGRQSAAHLFHRVIRSSNRSERLALIKLLPTFGVVLIPVLEECLKQQPPWSVLKNIIFIVSEIREESIYPLIQQNFSHEDRRVQHEMIRCVVKLGGRFMKDRLIHGLRAVNDSLKIYIIRILAEHDERDESVLSALCDLAEKRSGFSSNITRDLMGGVITALRAFPSRKSIDLLSRLQTEYEKVPDSDYLLLQIEQTLKILAPQLRHNRQCADDTSETITFESDPLQKQIAFNKLARIEDEARQLIHRGDGIGAGQLFYKQALAAANEKDFIAAEMLRDRILEVNPMALAEVVELGEWIEKQKTTLIGSHHIEIWSNLYDQMATEEFTALYQALRREDYRKGDPIIEAGESDESLYFINSGYISLSCISGKNERFLKRMGPSDVLGCEQFFAASVWTIALRALSDVQVQVLDYNDFRTISDTFPGFEEKLQKYCARHEKIPELLKMSGDDRREYARYPVSLSTKHSLRDPYGTKDSRNFNGELADISRNGLAFTIKISNRNNARLLLGRQIVTVIIAEGESLAECSGVVVGVRIQDTAEQNFTVHVKLSKKIDDTAFKRIVAMVP